MPHGRHQPAFCLALFRIQQLFQRLRHFRRVPQIRLQSYSTNGINTNDTYFHSTYNSFGLLRRLLTIPPNNYDPNPADGRNKVLNLLSNYCKHDLVILVVNDTAYGDLRADPGHDQSPIIITSLWIRDVNGSSVVGPRVWKRLRRPGG